MSESTSWHDAREDRQALETSTDHFEKFREDAGREIDIALEDHVFESHGSDKHHIGVSP